MMNFHVLLDFKRVPNDNLALFGSDVVTRMKGNARYESEQAQVTAVETAQQAFQLALNNASNGGRVLLEIRNLKRADLVTKLTVLAKMLELHTAEDITFFTESGFKVRKKAVRHIGPLEQPVLWYLRQGELTGSVDGESRHFPKSVREIGVEYSGDGGLNWSNGTYSSGKRFTLAGLQPRKEYLIRICYMGTRQRLSDFSEAMSIFVL